ncbi:MAG: Crp/Fnr family transcriptional regulator [Reichenbachiella sp.]|uniref:Crp/Fnr family transcriptional regulator n=1 Tax=Reichenbachiella sp. TaxID=2184521 RepID=UPI00326723B3
MDVSPLIVYFEDFWSLDDAAAAALCERITYKRVKRRGFLLRPGEICQHFNFVLSGCFKMYKVDQKGNSHNLQFAPENNWIMDHGSFYEGKSSELYIEALEPSEVLQIKNNDLFELYDGFPVFDRNFRIVTENAFIEQQKRVLHTISSTAEERYLYFLKRYPDLSNRISNVQIASYIGVTPEFLSVIRKKLATT